MNLKNLKRDMDQHVFQRNTFNSHSEQKIIQLLNQQNASPNRYGKFSSYYKMAISLICLMALPLFLYMYMSEELSTSSPSPSQKQPVGDNQEESFSDVTKDEIYNKMLDTNVHFDSIEGSYTEKHSNAEIKITFAAINGEQPVYYTKDISEGILEEETVYKENEIIQLFHSTKEYSITNRKEQIPPHQVLDFEYLYPKDEAMEYLGDFNNWEIKEETVLDGHDAVLIEGEIQREDNETQSFSIWVHVETGIWLKFMLKDANDNNLFTVTMNDLSINKKIDPILFSLEIPEEYSGEGDPPKEENEDNQMSKKEWEKLSSELKQEYVAKEEVDDFLLYYEYNTIILIIEVKPEYFDEEHLKIYGLNIANVITERNQNVWNRYQMKVSLVSNQDENWVNPIQGTYDETSKEIEIHSEQ